LDSELTEKFAFRPGVQSYMNLDAA
jgi:hypothetical protein